MIDPKALGDEIDAGRGRQAFSPEERRLLMVALHAYASRSAGAESIAAKYFGSLASEATAADWAAVVGQLERELAEERFEHEETKRDLYDERKASLKSAASATAATTREPDFKLVHKDGRTFIYLTRWNIRVGELNTGVSEADAQKVIDFLTKQASGLHSSDSTARDK